VKEQATVSKCTAPYEKEFMGSKYRERTPNSLRIDASDFRRSMRWDFVVQTLAAAAVSLFV